MEPIVLTLKDKRLFAKGDSTITLVGDNADYKIHFEGISKTAVFAVFNRDGKTEKKALDESNDVSVPVWLLKKGKFDVGLYSDGFASTAVSISVRASVVEDEGEETEDIEQPMIEQLIELVNKDIASVKETKTEATAAKDAAVAANEEVKAALESITDKDNGYLTKIKDYADSAKGDADSAAKNAEKIQGAVTAAENALSEAKDLKQVSVEILGEGGTFENPKDNTAFKQIRDIKEEISTAKADVIEAKNAAETAQTAAEANTALAEAARNAAQAAQAAVAADKATVKADRKAVEAAKESIDSTKTDIDAVKQEVFGTGNAQSPADGSALKEIRETKAAVDEFNNTDGSLAQAKAAAKTATDAAAAAKTAENNASASENNAYLFEQNAKSAKNAAEAAQVAVAADKVAIETDRKAVEAAKESVDSTKTDIDAVKQEVFGTGNAQNPEDGSALKEIREAKAAVDEFNDTDGSLAQAKAAAQTATNAKNVIVGESGTAQSPADGSALKKAQAAQVAAAQSAEEAKAYAESANHGISVDSEMSDTSTNPVQNKIVKKYIDDHKVEKVAGKGLSTNDYTTAEKNKLSGIADGANNYTHPDTHPASIVEEDASHRFVTDAEKAAWNGKVDKVSGKGLSTNDYTTAEKNKLSGIADGANNYTHPNTHPASIIEEDASHRFVTDTEKTAWNGKVDKVSGKGLSTNDYTTAEKEALANVLIRLAGLKIVISNTEPTAADENTLTIVVPN